MPESEPFIIAFTGHRAGFDPNPIQLELETILAELRSNHPGLIARTGAAEGADLIFAEAALGAGIPVEVFLPLDEAEFEKDFSSRESWQRAREVIAKAGKIHRLATPLERPGCYLQSGLDMLADANLLVAVWNGQPARGPGGTAHIIDEAKERDIETRIIPTSPEAHVILPDWAERMFAFAKLGPGAPPPVVLAKTDAIAEHLAPDTRRLWKWIIGLQGAAVLVPMLWLFVLRTGLPVPFAAISMVVCTLLVIAVCWWMRWRGMQTTWTQARVIAEIARSATATESFAPAATTRALAGSDDLLAIARRINSSERVRTSEKSDYLADRIEDQHAYYDRKLNEAIDARQQLSRYVTLSLDGSLFLAVAGLVLAFSGTAERWLRLSGSDLVIAVVGAALPLCAILLQMLGSYLELNRRTGRFSQQKAYLESAASRLASSEDAAELEHIAADVERQLLGEVVEWYYQSKLAEPYYRSKPSGLENRKLQKLAAAKQTVLRRSISWLGLGANFVGRVIFGRLLVAALSVIVTTALIAFLAPKDPSVISTLRREDGRLLSSATADGWYPDSARTENGFLLIAHGLHDGVLRDDANEEEIHWMTRLQDAVENSLGGNCPDICLVDWHFAAIPIHGANLGASADSDLEDAAMPTTPTGWLQDVAAIRSQGEEIGDLVGFKIARAIRNGELDQSKPMHFIGHSAGGFVVLRAALVLRDLGLASGNMKVTMLDTPLPVKSELEALVKDIPIDYYCTSDFAKGVPANEFLPGFRRIDIPAVEGIDRFLGAHSYAHRWYIESVEKSADPAYAEGFRRSPFAPK